MEPCAWARAMMYCSAYHCMYSAVLHQIYPTVLQCVVLHSTALCHDARQVRCIDGSACACDVHALSGAVDLDEWRHNPAVSVVRQAKVPLYAVAAGGALNGSDAAPSSFSLAADAAAVAGGAAGGRRYCGVELEVTESRLSGSGSGVHKFKVLAMSLAWTPSSAS